MSGVSGTNADIAMLVSMKIDNGTIFSFPRAIPSKAALVSLMSGILGIMEFPSEMLSIAKLVSLRVQKGLQVAEVHLLSNGG